MLISTKWSFLRDTYMSISILVCVFLGYFNKYYTLMEYSHVNISWSNHNSLVNIYLVLAWILTLYYHPLALEMSRCSSNWLQIAKLYIGLVQSQKARLRPRITGRMIYGDATLTRSNAVKHALSSNFLFCRFAPTLATETYPQSLVWDLRLTTANGVGSDGCYM